MADQTTPSAETDPSLMAALRLRCGVTARITVFGIKTFLDLRDDDGRPATAQDMTPAELNHLINVLTAAESVANGGSPR